MNMSLNKLQEIVKNRVERGTGPCDAEGEHSGWDWVRVSVQSWLALWGQ